MRVAKESTMLCFMAGPNKFATCEAKGANCEEESPKVGWELSLSIIKSESFS